MPLTLQFRDDLGDGLFLHTAIPSVGDLTGLPVAATEGSVEIALSTGTLTTVVLGSATATDLPRARISPITPMFAPPFGTIFAKSSAEKSVGSEHVLPDADADMVT